MIILNLSLTIYKTYFWHSFASRSYENSSVVTGA